MATLGRLLGTFDGAAAARARAGAADRALFDTSPEAILARKYEAATERSLFRTLREFREVEAEAATAEANAATPDLAEASEELGSSCPEVVEPPVADRPPAVLAAPGPVQGRSERSGRPVLGRSRGRTMPR